MNFSICYTHPLKAASAAVFRTNLVFTVAITKKMVGFHTSGAISNQWFEIIIGFHTLF